MLTHILSNINQLLWSHCLWFPFSFVSQLCQEYVPFSLNIFFFWIPKKKFFVKFWFNRIFLWNNFNKRNIYSQRFIATLSVPISMCILTQAIFNVPNVDIEFFLWAKITSHNNEICMWFHLAARFFRLWIDFQPKKNPMNQ